MATVKELHGRYKLGVISDTISRDESTCCVKSMAGKGFTSKDDTLPQRLFEELPDGPAKGRCVNKEAFVEMRAQYYDLLGWDDTTGNPRDGKLRDLGLEWAI